MYDWPQQASDAELDAAAALGGRMHDEGFVVLTFSDLTAGDDTAVLSPWDARVGLLRASVAEVRYEPTGEGQVAGVTQVCGEVWLRPWMHLLCVVAAHAAGLERPDAPRPTEHLEAVRRRNVPRFAAYVFDASRRLPDDEARAAMLAAYAVAGCDWRVVHDLLFPDGWTPRDMPDVEPADMLFADNAPVEPW